MSPEVPRPPAPAMRWLERELAVTITGFGPLPQADPSGPWRVHLRGGTSVVLGLVDDAPEDRARLATEVAALALAERHGIAAPRALAVDVTGAEAGQPALVQTWLGGTSRVPGPDEPARGRDLGRAAAAIHAVALTPTDELPERATSLDGVPFEALPVPAPAVDLFAAVREAVAAAPPPDDRRGLVHGDLWQGNTLWTDDGLVGLLDWDFAGVGHPTVDLGSLRWDLAVLVGEGPDDVLAGWSEASGQALAAEVVARSDLVAVLASPPDLALWIGNFHAQGLSRLSLDVVTARRDAFARQALAVLSG